MVASLKGSWLLPALMVAIASLSWSDAFAPLQSRGGLAKCGKIDNANRAASSWSLFMSTEEEKINKGEDEGAVVVTACTEKPDQSKKQNDATASKGKPPAKKATPAKTASTSTTKSQRPPPTITNIKEPPGLGGRSGIRPDVNSLKRNLVQEAVRAYKSELLELLGTPSGSAADGCADQFRNLAGDSSGGGGGGSSNGIGNKPADATASSSAAAVSALYGSVEEYDESKDGNKPVSYYKYGPGAALTGRTYAGDWATRDELIEDKLAALVQSNPVSTTTDSNLLEGQWEFVFSSHKASDIVDPSRFVLIRTEQGDKQGNGGGKSNAEKKQAAANKDAVGPVESRPWAIRSGRSENPLRLFTRKIYLEELKDDEDPYVVDTTSYMGGLWCVQRRYDVTGLSRTAMDLGLYEKDLRAFGLRIPLKKRAKQNGSSKSGDNGDYLGSARVQVIYLDSDLCITTTERGMDGPLLVYTKGNFWTAKRKGRFLLATAAWMWSKQSPLRIRQRLGLFRKSSPGTIQGIDALVAGPPEYDDEENRVMLQRTYDDQSRLMVLKMGETLVNPDGTLREDLTAWDGDADPFVHLDPIERQKLLKGMTIEAIEAAGKAQRKASKRSGKRYRKDPTDRSFKQPQKDATQARDTSSEKSFKKPAQPFKKPPQR